LQRCSHRAHRAWTIDHHLRNTDRGLGWSGNKVVREQSDHDAKIRVWIEKDVRGRLAKSWRGSCSTVRCDSSSVTSWRRLSIAGSRSATRSTASLRTRVRPRAADLHPVLRVRGALREHPQHPARGFPGGNRRARDGNDRRRLGRAESRRVGLSLFDRRDRRWPGGRRTSRGVVASAASIRIARAAGFASGASCCLGGGARRAKYWRPAMRNPKGSPICGATRAHARSAPVRMSVAR
jgi:hypothetical protein